MRVDTRASNKASGLVAIGFGFLALAIGVFCLQACYFFFTAKHVGFYATVLKTAGKSLATVTLPLLAAGILCAAAGGVGLWRLGRRPGLRKPIRWIGSVLAAVWLLLFLDFVGLIDLLPAGLLPSPPAEWVSADQVNLPSLLRVYVRTFAFRSLAPVEQWIPWLAAIAAFLFLSFFPTRARPSHPGNFERASAAET